MTDPSTTPHDPAAATAATLDYGDTALLDSLLQRANAPDATLADAMQLGLFVKDKTDFLRAALSTSADAGLRRALEHIAAIPQPPACGWLNAIDAPKIAASALAGTLNLAADFGGNSEPALHGSPRPVGEAGHSSAVASPPTNEAVKGAIEALEPFARYADEWHDNWPDESLMNRNWEDHKQTIPTLGDARRAR